MASATVAPSPTVSEGPVSARLSDEALHREMALQRAMYLSILLLWIEQARALTEEICLLAERESAVKEVLDRWDIRYHAAEWGSQSSDALHHLLSLQRELIAQGGGLN